MPRSGHVCRVHLVPSMPSQEVQAVHLVVPRDDGLGDASTPDWSSASMPRPPGGAAWSRGRRGIAFRFLQHVLPAWIAYVELHPWSIRTDYLGLVVVDPFPTLETLRQIDPRCASNRGTITKRHYHATRENQAERYQAANAAQRFTHAMENYV